MPEIYISWSFILCNIHTCNVNRFISWIFTSSEFQLHQKPVLFCLFASSDSLKRLWRASMELISRFMHVYFYFISFITMNNKLSRRCFLKYINRFLRVNILIDLLNLVISLKIWVSDAREIFRPGGEKRNTWNIYPHNNKKEEEISQNLEENMLWK